MKDIVFDTMIAKHFCNPISQQYKDVIAWIQEDGVICYSQYLLNEYSRGMASSASATNILCLIEFQLRRGINAKINNDQLKGLVFTKTQIKRLRSHKKDHPIIKTVLLSRRKFLVSAEANVVHDVNIFPGYS